VIRIARGLKNHATVYIAQHLRDENETVEDIHFISFKHAKTLLPDVVILLRQYRLVKQIANEFPHARKFLWLHNMPSRELYNYHADLNKHRFEIIAVSHFHREAILRRLMGKWFQRILTSFKSHTPIHVLYNPIDNLMPDQTRWKPNQLLFTSSPQKGLTQTLQIFEQLRHYFPEYYLLIANPGYSHLDITLPANAHFLGVLPHHQVIQQLRESFCVFYPQQIKIETFGLVYAEANAVGTPVLAHHWGAAREVLSDPQQLVNGKNFNAILRKIEQWRHMRPALKGKNEFLLKNIIGNWVQLLYSR
jgi:glycosyltransferase involved in cell wall biosynthesis